MASNLDGLWLAFSHAYTALQNEKKYFENLAQFSILEEDKLKFFRAAFEMEDLLAQMKSTNQATIDKYNGTALKGPDDATLEKAQSLASEFAKDIAANAKAVAIVTDATSFIRHWAGLA
ncbi:hypothetical protein JOD97_001123 [Duganella sp. 1411]|uniref:hypothetical protein n=1 Tax=Duganella sp. 1411 TaxID=2806572 RepID=UPI001AE2CB39|nr:hypothetical protein [Duganella sp. 1411]MBP1203109.1 hypothetical protein [Duganella sp. 1411]